MNNNTLVESVKTVFPNVVTDTAEIHGYPGVYAKKEGIKDLCTLLKSDPEFSFGLLADLFCVDYLSWEEKEFRFEVVYNLFSLTKNRRFFIKVRVPESDPAVDSVASLWPAANWYEREVWDMFGVKFNGHPNLKRILMYEEFKGHALRKDYPYNKRQPIIGPMN